MNIICDHQTAGTKCCISWSDRKYDNSQDCDDSSNRSEKSFCDFTNRCCCSCCRAWIIESHCCCSPDHSNQTFKNHCSVECHFSFFFMSYGTSDHCTLSRMETGCNTAGNCHKEYRNKFCSRCTCSHDSVKIRINIEDSLNSVTEINIIQLISLGENTKEYPYCWKQKDCSKDRVNPSNDLVDRKQRSYKIINQNHTINNPGPYIYICKTTDLTCKEISRCICKYRTDKEHQQAEENIINLIHFSPQKLMNDSRHLCTVLSQRHHST